MQYWTNECRSTRDKQGNPFPSENSWGGVVLLQAPRSNMVQSSKSLWRTCLPRKIRKPSACCKKTIMLWMTESSWRIPVENRKCLFWQTYINDQRSKLRVQINNIIIKGLLDMGVDVTIINSGSGHPNRSLEEADVQFLGIGTLAQVKQSTRWTECIEPEGQRGRLRPYLANIAVNLWSHDLLLQMAYPDSHSCSLRNRS